MDSLLDRSSSALRLGMEEDVGSEMKAGELIAILSQFGRDEQVVVETKSGYDFGNIEVKRIRDDRFLSGLATEQEQDNILIAVKR